MTMPFKVIMVLNEFEMSSRCVSRIGPECFIHETTIIAPNLARREEGGESQAQAS
jgi:hypothetical protein